MAASVDFERVQVILAVVAGTFMILFGLENFPALFVLTLSHNQIGGLSRATRIKNFEFLDFGVVLEIKTPTLSSNE